MKQAIGSAPQTKGRRVFRHGRPDKGRPMTARRMGVGSTPFAIITEEASPEEVAAVNAVSVRGFALRLGDVFGMYVPGVAVTAADVAA